MANPYTRFAPTQYQSQYVPAPLEQIAPAMQYASGLRQESQLADARTKKLIRNMLGSATTPEELAFVQTAEEKAMADISDRVKRGYSSQDAIEVELQAQETADALESVTNSREAIQNWEQEMRELNQDDVNPTALNTLIAANKPQITYDTENMRATAQTGPATRITPDLDLPTYIADNLNDIKPMIRDQGIDFDTRTGKFVETDENGNITSETVSSARVRSAANALLQGSEVKNYLNREFQVNRLQAENAIQQGVNPLGVFLEEESEDATDVQKEALDEVRKEIDSLKAQGYDDASIYANLKQRQEINSAMGFANTKHAYEDITRRTVSGANRTSQSAYNSVEPYVGPAVNNPNTVEFGTALSRMRRSMNGDTGGWNVQGFGFGTTGSKTVAYPDIVNPDSPTFDPKEFAQRQDIQEKFGSSMSDLMDFAPKQSEESNKGYMNRIFKLMHEQQQTMASRNIAYDPFIGDLRDAMNEKYFGADNEERLGLITDMQMSVSTPGQETKSMGFDAFIEHMGVSAAEAKELIFKKANMTGVIKSGDPQYGEAYEMVIPAEDREWFGGYDGALRVRVANPAYFKQPSIQNKIAVTNLRTSPQAKEYTFTDTMDIGNGRHRYKFRAEAENIWTGYSPEGRVEVNQSDPDFNLNKFYNGEGDRALKFDRRELILHQLDNDGNIVRTYRGDEARAIEERIGQ